MTTAMTGLNHWMKASMRNISPGWLIASEKFSAESVDQEVGWRSTFWMVSTSSVKTIQGVQLTSSKSLGILSHLRRNVCLCHDETLAYLKSLEVLFYFCFFFFFPGIHLRYMEVPRLGVDSKLQLWVYATVTATDLSRVCDLHHNSWQRRILDPLSETRDWILILMDTSPAYYCWATMGTPGSFVVRVCTVAAYAKFTGFGVRSSWIWILTFSLPSNLIWGKS